VETPIREVAAYEQQGNEYGEVYRITFLDGTGSEAKVYCPAGGNFTLREHWLADN